VMVAHGAIRAIGAFSTNPLVATAASHLLISLGESVIPHHADRALSSCSL